MKTIQQFGIDFKARIENAIQKLQNGQGILLVDDEDRENEGDIIYDPFSGSGTTCKIADRLGQAWFGSDIAEEYCSVALRRIENDLFTKAST